MTAPPPIALVNAARPDEVIAYACGTCGEVVGSVKTHGDDGARHLATVHCGPWMCDRCGELHTRKHYTLCDACSTAKRREEDTRREEAWFAKAKKVSWRDYDGPVFCDTFDKYYATLAEALEELYDEGHDMPEYLWGCAIEHPRLDVGDLVENALENMADGVELDQVEELTEFLKEWNAAQTGESWLADYGTAVMMEGMRYHAEEEKEEGKEEEVCP